MEQGHKIGNTTDYFVNPCHYTVKYYSNQINSALKQAFRENPQWKNPGSMSEVINIIDDIQDWYNPFLYTELVSSTFDRLWSQSMREIREMLNKKVPKVKRRSNRVIKYYNPEVLIEVIESLKQKGMSVRTIADMAEMHKTTIYRILNGDCSQYENKLMRFIESLGDEEINEKFLQGSRGRPLQKESPGRRRHKGGNDE
jgi:lambda repressor-like predicted transcriptional regulator